MDIVDRTNGLLFDCCKSNINIKRFNRPSSIDAFNGAQYSMCRISNNLALTDKMVGATKPKTTIYNER